MRERRRIATNEEDDFTVPGSEQITTTLTSITSVLAGRLSSVEAICLLIGSIGIMNVTLVSVTDRTREITVCLAIGVTTGRMQMQFLVEAIVLSLIGELTGIVMGLKLG